MLFHRITSIMLFALMLIAPAANLRAEQTPMEQATALRMVGHEVLLMTGDSSSRVLPIKREGERYRIAFDTEFAFQPEVLVTTIDRVVAQTGLPADYLFQVEECTTGDVVYSFSMNDTLSQDIVPCRGRGQPMGCYALLITFLAPQTATSDEPPFWSLVLGLGIVLLLGWWFFRSERRRAAAKSGMAHHEDTHHIMLGHSRFDPQQQVILVGQDANRVELSGKEVALLELLAATKNTTVAREVILQKVWGDEGDYVGRTLDVFISKLRKKLEGDSSLKIVNTRGVGYRLMVG